MCVRPVQLTVPVRCRPFPLLPSLTPPYRPWLVPRLLSLSPSPLPLRSFSILSPPILPPPSTRLVPLPFLVLLSRLLSSTQLLVPSVLYSVARFSAARFHRKPGVSVNGAVAPVPEAVDCSTRSGSIPAGFTGSPVCSLPPTRSAPGRTDEAGVGSVDEDFTGNPVCPSARETHSQRVTRRTTPNPPFDR